MVEVSVHEARLSFGTEVMEYPYNLNPILVEHVYSWLYEAAVSYLLAQVIWKVWTMWRHVIIAPLATSI